MKFIAFVYLLDALVKENILMRDPEDPNNILVKTDDTPENVWVSANIFTLAADLYRSKEQRDALYGAVKEKTGKVPVFTSEGDFVGLQYVN